MKILCSKSYLYKNISYLHILRTLYYKTYIVALGILNFCRLWIPRPLFWQLGLAPETWQHWQSENIFFYKKYLHKSIGTIWKYAGIIRKGWCKEFNANQIRYHYISNSFVQNQKCTCCYKKMRWKLFYFILVLR